MIKNSRTISGLRDRNKLKLFLRLERMTIIITRSSDTVEIARVGGHYALFKVIEGHRFWYH